MTLSSDLLPWSLTRSWLLKDKADLWTERLLNNLHWEEPIVTVFGKKYVVPRKTVFLAERGIAYSYSQNTHFGTGWPNWFIPLLKQLELTTKVTFNGCLLNLYRNGNDKMGWHSDDEDELNPDIPIASLSLGATRDFCFKHKRDSRGFRLTLCNGDLLLMHPPCQKDWVHSLPKRNKVSDLRINLTFRSYN